MAGKLPKKKTRLAKSKNNYDVAGWSKSQFRNYMRVKGLKYGEAKRALSA